MNEQKDTKKISSRLYDLFFITNEKPYKPFSYSLDTGIYIFTIISFISAIIYLFIKDNISIQPPGCFLHELTGYYCPGCGGTRAVQSLLKGDIINSFIYNPFVLYAAVPGIWLLITQSIFRCQIHSYKKKTKIISRTGGDPESYSPRFPLVRPLSARPMFLYIAAYLVLAQCLIKNLVKLIWDYSII